MQVTCLFRIGWVMSVGRVRIRFLKLLFISVFVNLAFLGVALAFIEMSLAGHAQIIGSIFLIFNVIDSRQDKTCNKFLSCIRTSLSIVR